MSTGQTLFHDALETPLVPLLVAVGSAALAAEVGLLLIARRRLTRSQRLQRGALAGDWAPVLALDGAPSRWLELCAPIAPLLILGVSALAVQRCRGLVLRVLDPVAAHGDNAQWIASGVRGELIVLVIGTLCVSLAGLLASVVIGVAVSTRVGTEGLLHGASLRARDPEAAEAFAAHPGPRAAIVVATSVGLVTFSLLPVLSAVLSAAVDKLRSFALVVELEPGAQRSALESAARTARGAMERGFSVSVASTMFAAVALGALLWRTAPARARALGRVASAPRSHAGAWLAVSALALAVALAALAAPMKQENELPWPPGDLHGLGLGRPPLDEHSTRKAPLEGPDTIEVGPLVEVTRDGVAIDRVQLGAAGIEPRLQELRRQFSLLHPEEEFVGTLSLACSADAPSVRVFQLLATIARAGYRAPTLVFETRHSVQRPVLGTLELRHVTGARVQLVDAADRARPGSVLVQASDASTWGGAVRAHRGRAASRARGCTACARGVTVSRARRRWRLRSPTRWRRSL